MIRITAKISIREDELTERFIHASGPGGQNVNKVATAVQLQFNAAASPSLSEEVRERLTRLAGHRISDSGVLTIQARRYRTRERNRRDALERLVALIARATERPKPRRKTKPTLASKKRRLETKRQRSQTKNLRLNVNGQDE